MRVKFGDMGTKDVPITEVTPENYIVPAGEEMQYHVIQEIKRFDASSGKRLSRPRVQKYGYKEFNTLIRNIKSLGYDIIVLHDPTEYIKQRDEEIAATKGRAAQTRKQRTDAMYEEVRKRVLDDLRAEGIIPSGEAKKSRKTKKADAGDNTSADAGNE